MQTSSPPVERRPQTSAWSTASESNRRSRGCNPAPNHSASRARLSTVSSEGGATGGLLFPGCALSAQGRRDFTVSAGTDAACISLRWQPTLVTVENTGGARAILPRQEHAGLHTRTLSPKTKNGADDRTRTDLWRLAVSGPTPRPHPHGAPCWIRTNLTGFVAQCPHPKEGAKCWCGRRDSNSHQQLGRLRSCRWTTPAQDDTGLRYQCQVSSCQRAWHRWLESNQRDAVLETAPTPRSHRHNTRPLRGDRRELNPGRQGHNLPPIPLGHGHTATVERWSRAQDSNLPPLDTSQRCSSELPGGGSRGSRTLPSYIPSRTGHPTQRADELEDPAGLKPAPSCLRNRRTVTRAPDPWRRWRDSNPRISCVTSRRGRPDSSTTPKSWWQGWESNPLLRGYEPRASPIGFPATTMEAGAGVEPATSWL